MEKTISASTLNGWLRSHTCSELSETHLNQNVTLMGWVHRRRDHGSVIFLDLRDRFGITQIVLDPAISKDAHTLGEKLRNEFVIAVRGAVRARPEGMLNGDLSTGQIEVVVETLKILSACEPLPFPVNESTDAGEALRLKYRYLDLRREELQKNLVRRSAMVTAFRRRLEEHGFLDIETPYLYKSTPEGAREFLVPSRVHPGNFYALPQSPQLFKQLLMIGGFDRYYQVVRCFRDEDLRSDRQPEFTQVDCELSFVEQETVLTVFEDVARVVAKQALGTFPDTKFPRLKFADAMEWYGNDKPDIRFELKLVDLSKVVAGTKFKVFAEALSTGGIVNALVVPGGGERISRKDLDQLTEVAQAFGAKGMAWAKKNDGSGAESWASPIAKFIDAPMLEKIEETVGLKVGDLVLFGAGPYGTTKASLGQVRLRLANLLSLIDKKVHQFCWITDFPLFEADSRSGRLVARHHPFTSPLPEDLALLDTNPEAARAAAYDLVLNGHEIAGGSIRIHDPEIQDRIFRLLGLSADEAREKFGFLIDALRYGAPPHGGIAFGLDRLAMCLLGSEAIRDVIAFPKTQKAACLLTDSPATATAEQLRDLHIRVQKLPGERHGQ